MVLNVVLCVFEMSSRQRARLRGNEKRWLEDGENEIEQNSEEEESIDQNFYQIESVISSSSSNSDEEPEENSDRESLSESDHQISRSIKSDIQHFKKRERILGNTVDLINVEAPCEDDTFLYTNPHGLDVDYIFSLNLGRHVTGISYGNSRRNKIRQVRRNQVFGLPKEEWPKPLNYINGGIQMVECTSPDWWANQHFPLTVQWYQFQYSSDYSRKQNDFQIIRNSGDINLLILYLSVNPTHIDSLIHLSTLFTQLGQMDRASDLIRRCIYYHEVAYSSSFRPCRNSDHVACCLSWDAHENQSYYHALFLHFQMVWMKGFLTVAVDLLKLILSLNPIVDPKHTLLLLDKFLLMAGRYEEIDHFCRPSSSFVLCLPTLEGEHELLQLQDIFPNWAYTLALSHRLYEEKMKLNVSTAHQLLLKAIRRFPFVLKFYEGVSMPSLERQQWESVQNHPFFKHFMVLER